MFRSARWWAWLACGAVVALVALKLAGLSGAFVWGDSARWAARPIREVVLWWMAAWVAYAAALRLGSALPPRVPSLVALLLLAGGARAAFFGTNPIQEDDAYRYLWDGQQVRAGVDPYRWAPKEVADIDAARGSWEVAWANLEGEPAEPGLEKLRGVLRADPAARENFRKINHKSVPTVYPPLNMPVYALAQGIAPWSLDGLRAVFLVLELATVALLWFALRAAGANPMWAAVYAWCPLTIKEMANSPHHDALVVCCLAAFLLCAVAEKPRWAAAALALATAAKFYPVALAPILVAWTWRRDRREAAVTGAVFAAVLFACYAPFLSAHTFRGAGVFAGEWSSNSGAFTVLQRLATRVFGNEPVAFWGVQGERGSLYARAAAAALVAGAVAAAALAPRIPRPAIAPVGRPWDLPFRCYLAFAAGFALAPAQHPWYFAGILPFVALFPYRSWVLLTGTLALYYLRFYFNYNPAAWNDLLYALRFFHRYEPVPWKESRDFGWIRFVEYAPFYVLLVYEGLSGWAASRQPAVRGQTGAPDAGKGAG